MNEKETGPIGVFDSGYGGLTVLKELKKKLPEYDYLYLGDNARTPYGTRSFELVYEFTLQAVQELFARGCSLVILACNTASAKALRTIQMNDLPHMGVNKKVLGVIRPSAEVIGDLSKTKHVGILATPGTVKSGSYTLELAKFFPEVSVTEYACPMWVPLIENNEQDSESGREFIKHDLDEILKVDSQIDTIVLGCTHYPLVEDYLNSIAPTGVSIISQGKIIADSLADYLKRHPEIEQACSKESTTQFLTTENPSFFDENGGQFYGESVQAAQISLGK